MPNARLAILPVTPIQQNCTLLWDDDDKRCMIVDPGGDADRILDFVRDQGLKPELLLLTHGHLDHAGGAADMKEALGIPLLGPDERDRFLLEGIEDSARRFGIDGLRNVLPDRFLSEGETVELGAFRFDILHCPGHSPGSLVYVEKTMRFAFVGDVLFRGSIGRTDFPYGDHAALIAAIRTKLFPLGDDIRFICGHGEASSFGAERRSNPFVGEDA